MQLSAPSQQGPEWKTWHIVEWTGAYEINGLPLDLRLRVRGTKRDKIKDLGIVFTERMPEGEYPFEVLWVNQGEMNWLRS